MPDFLYYDILNFSQAMIAGVKLCLVYDGIRVYRRIVTHRKAFWIGVEDIIYWIYAGIELFLLSFETRDGVVRLFIIVGAIVGAAGYQYLIGRFLVKFVAKMLNFPLKLLKRWGTMILCKVCAIYKREEDELGTRKGKR